jgi:hypothetical protein
VYVTALFPATGIDSVTFVTGMYFPSKRYVEGAVCVNFTCSTNTPSVVRPSEVVVHEMFEL